MAVTIPFLQSLRGLFGDRAAKSADSPDDGVGKIKTVPFPELAAAWRERCAAFPFQRGAETGRRAAVLVTSWLGTPVPFYNMEVARLLAAAGDRAEVVFDGENVFGNAPNPAENAALAETIDLLPDWMPVHRVERAASAAPSADDLALARQIIAENAVWRTRGESTATEFIDRKREDLDRLAAHVAKVRHLVANSGIEWLLIPGGIWGLSRAYVVAAQRAGIRFATFDTGAKMMVFSQDGVASHQSDLPRALALTLEHITPAGREKMIAWARHELGERMQGRGNYFKFQSTAASGTTSGGPNVFVPLNLRWDSAALGRERLFPSVKDWVTAIVRWAEREPLARVCFRQHPAERFKAFKTTDDVGALVAQLNTVGDRVRFVAAQDPVNSYDLLGDVRVLLPFTSSMGAEAPILGIPVVTSAQNYYDTFDFVNRAETPDEYFALATRAIRGELSVTPAQSDLAALVYCLVQHCNFMPTGFTAAPTDFMEWVKVPPAEMWKREDLIDLQRALRSGEPLAFIRQQRFAAES